jgi:hypothetical protein
MYLSSKSIFNSERLKHPNMSDLRDSLLEGIAEIVGPDLVVQGRNVLTDRTHIKTGALRKSLDWERTDDIIRLKGLFYGEILQARKLEMKKKPPGPQAVGWIEEAVGRTIENFRSDLGPLRNIVELSISELLQSGLD